VFVVVVTLAERSPKLQLYDEGETIPVELAVKVTVIPPSGEAGLTVLTLAVAPGVPTVRLNVFIAVAPPVAVPVTVIVEVPVVAVREAVKVTSTLQGEGDGEHVGGDGLKLGVTPLGRVERLKVTVWAVPLVSAALRVTELLVVPGVTLIALGETATAKTNPLRTVRVIWAVCVRLPETPDAVIV
jgi:hypothetical protein